jgi:hypothetical protein
MQALPPDDRNKHHLNQPRHQYYFTPSYRPLGAMETILTPRLKLTLIKTIEEGSQDLEWAHIVRTDAQATYWRLAFLFS